MPTERIYYSEPHTTAFEARVLEIVPAGGGSRAAILDRTAFHPTGGGQPHDTGLLGGVAVSDVREGADGVVHHVLASEPGFAPGDTVGGQVDGERRRDHLEQHSGQHLLSAAFVHVADAATVSFHLGAETSTIDVRLSADVARVAAEAESLANRVIAENRPMTACILDEEEALGLPLRKELPVEGRVRIVGIEDFDLTPCGGTHATRTGEIRMVAILGTERNKGGTRVEFVAGGRVRRLLHILADEAAAVGALVSAPRGERARALAGILDERKQELKRLRTLAERAAGLEADALDRSTPPGRPVRALLRDRSAEEVAALGRALADRGRLALLGVSAGGAGRILLGSPGTPHAGDLLREVLSRFGGKGGGGPRGAQAGGLEPDSLETILEALEAAAAESGGK